MKKIIVIFSFLVNTSLSAEEKDQQQSLLQSRPGSALINEIIELKPVAGHHFNVKAPQKCGAGAALELSPRKFRCQLTELGAAKITASICDDQVTFCRSETFAVQVAAPNGYRVLPQGSAAQVSQSPGKGKLPIGDFIMNDPARALAQAKKKNELLFIDFYAIWCEPCNMLDEFVFKRKEFVSASQGMVKLALDADSDLSWGWKSHFKVGGYPTVIIANSSLREIGRIVGDRPLIGMLHWMAEQEKVKGEPIEFSKSKKRIGLWHYEREEYDEAVAALEGLGDREAREHVLLARRDKAKKEDDAKTMAAMLKQLAERFSDDVEYGQWISDFFPLDRAYALAHVSAVRKSLESWRNSPNLADTMENSGTLYVTEAEILEAAGDKGQAQASYLNAARYFAAAAEQSDLRVSRGAGLLEAYSLRKAGKIEEAKALYERLLKAYGEEFTFNYYYASTLLELKEYDKAYGYAKKAEANSYGDNWLRSVGLKAKIERALGKNNEARSTLETALASAVLPRSTDVRTHNYLAKLRQLLAKGDRSQQP